MKPFTLPAPNRIILEKTGSLFKVELFVCGYAVSGLACLVGFVALIAYHNTLIPPKSLKPDQSVFLEFAPIKRRYDIPYEQQQDANLAEGLHALEANLAVFPKGTAQVLEYWLDVSRFSRWKRPDVKLPWNKEVFLADVETYRNRGNRTTMKKAHDQLQEEVTYPHLANFSLPVGRWKSARILR